MSCSMVSHKTVDSILSGARWLDSYYDGRPIWIDGRAYYPDKLDDMSELGQAMLYTNALALQARYGDRIDDEMRRYIDTFRATLADYGPVQAYKSAECWLYQCSEGDIPDTPVYRAVKALADCLAMRIISEMPEYDRAEWDIPDDPMPSGIVEASR